MRMVGIAVLVMVASTLGVHMGLPQAIAQVVVKVSKCHKCLTFWLTLAVLVVTECPILLAGLLSLVGAYGSYWFGLVLIRMQRWYNELWERARKMTN